MKEERHLVGDERAGQPAADPTPVSVEPGPGLPARSSVPPLSGWRGRAGFGADPPDGFEDPYRVARGIARAALVGLVLYLILVLLFFY